MMPTGRYFCHVPYELCWEILGLETGKQGLSLRVTELTLNF